MFYGIKSSAFLLHETKIGKGGRSGEEGGGEGGRETPLLQPLGNDTSLLLA